MPVADGNTADNLRPLIKSGSLKLPIVTSLLSSQMAFKILLVLIWVSKSKTDVNLTEDISISSSSLSVFVLNS